MQSTQSESGYLVDVQVIKVSHKYRSYNRELYRVFISDLSIWRGAHLRVWRILSNLMGMYGCGVICNRLCVRLSWGGWLLWRCGAMQCGAVWCRVYPALLCRVLWRGLRCKVMHTSCWTWLVGFCVKTKTPCGSGCGHNIISVGGFGGKQGRDGGVLVYRMHTCGCGIYPSLDRPWWCTVPVAWDTYPDLSKLQVQSTNMGWFFSHLIGTHEICGILLKKLHDTKDLCNVSSCAVKEGPTEWF